VAPAAFSCAIWASRPARCSRVEVLAERLLSMINQMLAVSLEDARRSGAGAAAFDLAELIDDATALIKPILHAGETEVAVDLAGAPQSWTGDGHEFDQCLKSALSAAAEFAGRGAIRISALAVFDQGCLQLQLEIAAAGERIGACELRRMGADAGSGGAHAVGASALELARNTARLMGGELKISAVPGGARLVVRVPARPTTPEPLVVAGTGSAIVVNARAFPRRRGVPGRAMLSPTSGRWRIQEGRNASSV
jgi:signal transduction histidine kinase